MTEGKTNKKIDTVAIEEHIRGILVALGDNPEREGIKGHSYKSC